MSQVQVHVSSTLTPEQLQRIRDVSPRVELSWVPNRDWLHGAGPHLPPPERAAYLRQAEVLVGSNNFFQMEEAPRLRWLQSSGAGVEKLRGMPVLASDVIITNARIFAIPISEYIFASILAYCRHIPRATEQFRRGRHWPNDVWKEYLGDELSGKTLVILGYGSIGQKTAALAGAFGMNVLATRRRINDPVTDNGIPVYPSNHMHTLLPQADFLILSQPLTPETEGSIGETELRMMKPNVYIVNVGRGKIIQRAALEKALNEGWIGGAGLDVHDPTPPGPDYPFYDSTNVIMTPHEAGVTRQYYDRLTDLVCENLRRYLAGEPLLNVIDKQAGY